MESCLRGRFNQMHDSEREQSFCKHYVCQQGSTGLLFHSHYAAGVNGKELNQQVQMSTERRFAAHRNSVNRRHQAYPSLDI